MIKKFLLILISAIPYMVSAQKNNTIKYYFPDTVEVIINDFIKLQQPLNKKQGLYLQLEKDTGVYKLLLVKTDFTSRNSWWIRSTTRVAVVNKHLIPLIFDYDEAFSTGTINVVGSFGKRDGEIRKAKMIYHVPAIYFNEYGQVIKTESLK